MKVLVLCDAAGNITSAAIPGRELSGRLHMEVEGGAAAREIDVDEGVIQPEELLGRKGEEARTKALQKLRQLMS